MKNEIAVGTMMVPDTEMKFNDSKYNRALYKKILESKNKIILAKFSSAGGYNFELIELSGNTSGRISLVNLSTKNIDYNVVYKIKRLGALNKNYLTQIKVWNNIRSPGSKGLPEKIFWTYLFPKTELILADFLQTEAGKGFWYRRIEEAWKKKHKVYAVYVTSGKLVPIVTSFDLQKYESMIWGHEVGGNYEHIRACISKKSLLPKTGAPKVIEFVI